MVVYNNIINSHCHLYLKKSRLRRHRIIYFVIVLLLILNIKMIRACGAIQLANPTVRCKRISNKIEELWFKIFAPAARIHIQCIEKYIRIAKSEKI